MNQRELAKRLGYNQSTVSLALRNDPTIAAETCKKIQEEAYRLGYRQNPYVSSLMAQVRAGKPPQERGSIALLVNHESKRQWLSVFTYEEYYSGICKQAKALGFHIDLYFLRSMDMSISRLDTILYMRGVKGIILASPGSKDGLGPEFQWNRYAVATSSEVWPEISDRVANDHFRNAIIAHRALVEKGYKRIGVCLPQNIRERRDSRWLGGYCQSEYEHFGRLRVPVFWGNPGETELSTFATWLKKYSPDVILTLTGTESKWLEKLKIKVPEDISLACMIKTQGSKLSGVIEGNEQLGTNTMELLSSRIIHNQFGLGNPPRLILVSGKWSDGVTTR